MHELSPLVYIAILALWGLGLAALLYALVRLWRVAPTWIFAIVTVGALLLMGWSAVREFDTDARVVNSEGVHELCAATNLIGASQYAAVSNPGAVADEASEIACRNASRVIVAKASGALWLAAGATLWMSRLVRRRPH